MITVPGLAAEALGSFLTIHMGRRFSSSMRLGFAKYDASVVFFRCPQSVRFARARCANVRYAR